MFSDNFEELLTKNFSTSKGVSLLLEKLRNYSDRDTVLQESKQIKNRIFKNKIFSLVPLYVTSICNENCRYCNFKVSNKKILRKRLSRKELLLETDYLIKKGFRVIELVYSTDPLVTVSDICQNIIDVKKQLNKVGGGVVGLNSEAFDEDEYRALKHAGVDFIVLWQETYDKEIYQSIHSRKTKKSDFNYRVNAYERMLNAGIDRIGMGVLSGLADWKYDWSMLILHQEYLSNNYSMKPPIIGIPRLKVVSENDLLVNSNYLLNDDEYLFCIAIQNLYNPLSLPFVNTRENWNLCCKVSEGGGGLFTFNCSTIPGGYSLGSKGYQFPTYNFDVDNFESRCFSSRLSPIFDWNFKNIYPDN